jgi:hypothetical protein
MHGKVARAVTDLAVLIVQRVGEPSCDVVMALRWPFLMCRSSASCLPVAAVLDACYSPAAFFAGDTPKGES